MDSFEQFCCTSTILWTHARQDHLETTTHVVLIDLWHNSVQYLLRSLLIAKYIQYGQPVRLIGLLGKPGVVTRSCDTLDVAFNERLARSFGVTEFQSTSPPGLDDLCQANMLLDRLELAGDLDSSRSAELRAKLIDLTLDDGFPIGRFAYDTTLRSELRPTIERIDARLRHWLADCLALHRWMANFYPDGNIRPMTLVTGHLDYNPWGLAGEAVRRAGGEVVWFRIEANVPLYRIRQDGAGTLNAAYHRIEAEWFEETIAPLGQELAAGAEAFIAQSASGVLHQRWTAVRSGALSAMASEAAAASCRLAYGWNAGSIVLGVFAHALSDQPVADDQAYADRYQWLAQTLAFAAGHPERCWLIKLHPRDAAYDATGACQELMQRFGRLAHIRFVEPQVAAGVLEALCDVAVTIFGAPGLAMAMAGRPVIVAGNGPYAGCGFVHQARDRAEYQALLLADPAALRPTPAQTQRAKLYAYAARVIGAPSSPLLDTPTTPASDPFWQLAEARLRQHSVVGDDLCEAVRRMMQDGQRRSTNPSIDRHRGQPGPCPSTAEPWLPLLASEPLTFHSDGSGVRGLVKGFATPDPSGVWGTEEVMIIGFRLEPSEDGRPVSLALAYRSLGSTADWPAQMVRVFSPASCLGEHEVTGTSGEITILVPAEDVTEEGDVVLSLAVDHLRSPLAMGISADARRLSIGLLAIAKL